VTVNRRYLRIFLIFLILFGAYQIYGVLTIDDPAVSKVIPAGVAALIGIVILSAAWFLKNIK